MERRAGADEGTSDLLNPMLEAIPPKPLPDKVDAPAETSACTSKPESVQQPGTVEALAAALQALTQADRTRLAAMLLD